MKGIWRTNPGGDAYWPNWVRLHTYGVTRIYFPLYRYDVPTARFVLNDTGELTPEYVAGVRSQGIEYATYNCWNWVNSYSNPVVMANEAVEIMNSLGTTAHMFNDETHDSDRILILLKAFRTKRARGPISWALEGMQGGWFKKSLVNWINGDTNCVVVPEAFLGDMVPLPINKVRANLIAEGIATNRVKVFLDASKPLDSTWDGCLLSEETLR